MVTKTLKQEKLEVQRKKEIRQIIREALENHRADKNMAQAAAIDLGITSGTIYQWCRELDIDLEEYHKPAPSEEDGQE
jgi:transcriptional regulator with PAS, ATPase and Fis domain